MDRSISFASMGSTTMGRSMLFCASMGFTTLNQGLKFAVSRYPWDTEIWFWILSLFYLYPDGIPHFLKIGIAVNVLVVSPHFCSLNSAVTQASIRHNVVFM
jgi:hypothetical protein